mgnify:CR=1 FL=1
MCVLRCVLELQEQSRDDAVDLKEEDVIPNTPSLITFSSRGYIKRMPVSAWDVQKRGGKGKQRRQCDPRTMQWLWCGHLFFVLRVPQYPCLAQAHVVASFLEVGIFLR